MKWTIPNTLTVLRLLAAPGVAVMFLYFARPWADWFALVLFLVAAITDYFDGYLARLWRQESRMGAMLDPIADKAMVVIALLVLTGYSGMDPWLILPATVILFREVFVSGLREYLGNTSRLLAVTKLAKWKTTAQMVAISTLFAALGLEYVREQALARNREVISEMASTGIDAQRNLLSLANLSGETVWTVGLLLIWIAAALTAITGWDYFRKALPHLGDRAE
ncbi:MAG: CDP-diacylglycerol--glycerol-3-phosphate 3-phosphatidyltransferase [Rhodobacter sp.]|uniref:CDP-diacylglycerol--glycerol-3-phosphate 3-phosphatidyltransferase n=1 Tax=Pararhodobacter sp. TaxID=2127056 RepID=UPI001DD523CB|nr:CDP-diacylglycerol--glycerol-3-phosphate 3-phosphatidyltransferase [Pararhodobacter sp.]MCB1343995.1 CDP-diacylglycerol--glycerol-3-phosphate 3-phosphatidyltransferase [Paracoccaceae bacterium]MCC0071748.1 CDP-diacylglycerol--glycerol-3-phosphate 3-phosphatidyltransferase [Rhodobacter sp.]HPD93258.1 CDP-diacylglycerol--glycerol-3-phosphate 3-phosphatidyltransferase [Pararhodobacter sp.]